MFNKNKLLDELIILRDELRNLHFTKTNEEILICTDQALTEIVRKKPHNKSDFLAISGLEEEFINKYANEFLKIINRFKLTENKEVKVSKKAYKVLNNYKDRLTNISKTNPNLYIGKIHKIKNFDLTTLEDASNIINFLTNEKINNIKLNTNNKTFDALTVLYRNINKEVKESGTYNLYIAYPYVLNYIKREKFAIKAPLLFFPVKLSRNKRDYQISKDFEKDILFNRDLLLTSAKFNKSNVEFNTPQISEFNLNILNKVVIPFYNENGIVINDKINEFNFIPFKNELKEDFIKNKFKNFTLENYLVLGRYQVHSTMIQKDINDILNSSKYNELLEGLIEEDDLYKENKQTPYKPINNKVDEFNINYINDLNDAQEHVIEILNNHKKLVIWGPPGTGKSQTITSLIANSVLKGENVLVVSEKKVALDVIYSRLGSASKYAMFIDDAENKQNFYNKLSNFIEPTLPTRTLNNDIFKNETEITSLIKKLDKSISLLYKEIDTNVSINNLFDRYLKNNEINEELLPSHVLKMFLRNFKNIDYKIIKKLEETFDKDNQLKEYINYYQMLQNYPILSKLDTKITRSSKIEFNNFSDRFNIFKNNYDKSNVFKKRRLRKKFIENELININYLSVKNSVLKTYLKTIIKDATLNTYIKDNINKLNKIETKYQQLNLNEIKYVNMYVNDFLINNIDDNYKLRKYLFDAFYTGFLEEFKTKNQKDLYVINNYHEKANKINQLIDEKRQISKESFEMELFKNALNFSNSKRIMDIKRTIESQKRPSIRSFLNIFRPEMFQNVKIWMMTPEVLSTIIPLEYGMFDLVIFDEASQMYVEKGIPAIYRAKKVVIAGDPKQLRPSSLGIGRIDNDLDELFEDDILKDVSIDAKSLLDLARYKYHETILNYHYRSKYEELIAFSNHAFYDSKLIVSPNQTVSKKPPIEYIYVKDAIFSKRSNKAEARVVVDTIKEIFKTRKNNETIGVITFNSAQRDLIENYIDEELFKAGKYQKAFEKELFRRENDEDKSLFVKNIENVQGDERDIIIFSMGYAKDSSGVLMRRFGWLNHDGGQNRLNVAITRAKEKIYFISSLYPEEFKVDDLISYGPKLLKDFMRYCYFISNNNNEMAKVVLNELHSTEKDTKIALENKLIEDVMKRLKRFKYDILESVGIGRYKIDLAIYDKTSKEYKLGIICDVNNYDNLVNSRKDLIHQERYLKARGWNIYRVFSQNWYIDPNSELKAIREMLKKVE